jgi:cytochrome c
MRRFPLILINILLATASAEADERALGKGKALVETNCAICHAAGPQGSSPLRDAPPFRDVATRYDGGELEDALNEGVATEHPAMPDWQMTPEQAHEISTYIMSLAVSGMKKSELEPHAQ